MSVENTHQDTDDGTLKFLNIKSNLEFREFNCEIIRQQDLINRDFYIIGFFRDIKTKYGLRYLVHIKFDLNDSDSKGRKFFTNSKYIMYTLDKIEELDAFPRKANLIPINKSFVLE